MATIKAYVAGKKLERREWRIARHVVTNLLLIEWSHVYNILPALSVDSGLLLADLPFLSDGEKQQLCKWFKLLFHEGQWDFKVEGGKPSVFNITTSDIDACLRMWLHEDNVMVWHGWSPSRKGPSSYLTDQAVGHWNEKQRLPYDFRTLRLCTLLYRPSNDWTAEERAIMRELGVRYVSRSKGQKLYRPSW